MTTVRRSPKEDREARLRAYLIAMAVRTVSFPLAVWALLSGWLVPGLVLAAAATFLPQIAVTIANVVDNRTTGEGTVRSTARALTEGTRTPGQVPEPGPQEASGHETDHGRESRRETDQGHDAQL